jgi:hypothetical protein
MNLLVKQTWVGSSNRFMEDEKGLERLSNLNYIAV